MWKLKSAKTMAVILSSVMLLAACSGNGNGSTGQETNNDGQTPGNQPGDVPAKRGSITVSMYDRGNVPAEAGTAEKNSWTDWVVENGPADVKFITVPRWESTDKFNVLLASGDAPDLIQEYATGFRDSLYRTGQLIPIDELIEEHSTSYKELLESYPVLRKAGTKPDGKLYEIGKLSPMLPDEVMFVRKDWLDKLNLQAPTTDQELLDVMRAFASQDPDANGKDDTYGIADAQGRGLYVIFQDVDWVVQDGQLVKDWERKLAALDYHKKIYEEGLIDKDYLTDKNREQQRQFFLQGRAGVYTGRIGNMGDFNLYETFRKNNPDGELIVIPWPSTKYGNYLSYFQNPVQMTAVVNATAKDPAAVIKYVDFMSQEATGQTLLYGFEGTHWEKSATGCPKILDDELYKNEVSWTVDFQMMFSKTLLGDCATLEGQLNPEVPLQKEFLDLFHQAEASFEGKDIPWLTHPEHMPTLPDDLQIITSTINPTMEEISTKAIITKSYSAEQAIQDMQKAWDSAGGKKLEEWYAKWYAENGSNAILAKDLIEFNESLK